MDGAQMQVALAGQEDVEEWMVPLDVRWHVPLPYRSLRSKDKDDAIAKAFFVAMGLAGVALVSLTVATATRKR